MNLVRIWTRIHILILVMFKSRVVRDMIWVMISRFLCLNVIAMQLQLKLYLTTILHNINRDQNYNLNIAKRY